MEKNLDYYLGLHYEVVLTKFEEDTSVYYKAITRDLPDEVFYGIGASPNEAVEALEECKRDVFQYYLEEGIKIPEPAVSRQAQPSGRFVVRISPSLHIQLAELAERQRQSLNTLVTTALSHYLTLTYTNLSWKDRINELVLMSCNKQYIIVSQMDCITASPFVKDKENNYGNAA